MSSPQDLVCPDPVGCPVIDVLPELELTTIPAGTALFRAYGAPWGYDEFSPVGNARFSPFDLSSGVRVPAMYLAADPASALLESVFHDIDPMSTGPLDRIIYAESLLNTLLAHVKVPADARLGDLRNEQLRRLGIDRDRLTSSSAEHYPCTRRLALASAGRDLDGLIWHSRKAELVGEQVEVMVLFGHRYLPARGRWPLAAPGIQNLWEGSGRTLIDEIATKLNATVL